MLNFESVISQIGSMVESRKDYAEDLSGRIRLALEELASKSAAWEELSRKVELSKTSWLVAGITSSPGDVRSLPARPPSYTALSSDGSQIFPDRHEALPCYLVNISEIVLTYGERGMARLSSLPYLFHDDEDRFVTWGGRKIPADVEVISLKRTLMEFQGLLKSARYEEIEKAAIAISDGTLILWRLEGTPSDFKNETLVPFLSCMDGFRELGIPVAGYISSPGSSDVVNALRVGLCPEEVSYCDQCPYTALPSLPCSPIEGVTDSILFSRVLKPGEMSPVFRSSSKILDSYGPHRVSFFYLNIGEEIARVEIPEWVAADEGLLTLAHTLVFDQAKKGGGYPIALAEAHEQAVVRGKDRDFFFDLVREAMVKSDFTVRVSRKGLSKRIPGL